MTMTNEEICREYRQAKTPLKQIGILADENSCTKREIAEILRGAGEKLPKTYKVKDAAAAETPHPSAAPTPSPEGKAAEMQLPGLDAGRVAVAAVDAIARLLKDSDTGDESDCWNFMERVRGVLMLAHALTETEDEE